MGNVIEQLQWRGLLSQTTDKKLLEEHLGSGAVTFYCGFDPTAPSLHLGNLVQLLTMRRLQLFGHKPLVVVGGATGLIGDPRPSSERVLHTKDIVANWVDSLSQQVGRFLDFEGDFAARVVNNLEWTQPLSAIDFLRDFGKHFRVGKMLAKDAVHSRLSSDSGISYTEFSYQILQSLDFLELYRKFGCTLQLGGSDQWGNLTAGADLIHRVMGKSVHLLVTPLVTNADGKKFGKSEGNAVWLDSKLTTPYVFYQYWLNVDDLDVVSRLRVFTFREREEIEQFEVEVAESAHLRRAQKALAYDVTSLVHGESVAKQVVLASEALFGKGSLGQLDLETFESVVQELSKVEVVVSQVGIVDLLFVSGLVSSKAAARRTFNEGGVYVNNVKVESLDVGIFVEDLLFGKYLLLRRGRKNLVLVEAL